jgi:hypothetical protein
MGKALRNIVKVVRNINTEYVHSWNSSLPAVPRQATIVCLQRRRQKKLLLTKGSVSHYGVCHLPEMLGPLADGGDPFLRVCDYNLLEDLEKREAQEQEDSGRK